MRHIFFFLILCTITTSVLSQSSDTLYTPKDSVNKDVQVYSLADQDLLYAKPKPFAFVTLQPKTFAHAAKLTFRKKSIPAIAVIAASTLLLIPADQKITDGVNQFYRYVHINPERDYKSLIRFHLGKKEVNTYDVPLNFNSVLYSIGEGSSSVFLAGGLSLYGRIKNDYRTRQASSQIFQSLIAVGITTQILKRVSGRESPFLATQSGGTWRPLPNLSYYQKNVPMHDAFPSGHMTTMMATVTIMADNFPEKKWIRPVGYSVMSLVGVAMIGNGVHWMSDYPLAIGLGYVVGKATVKMNRIVQKKFARR